MDFFTQVSNLILQSTYCIQSGQTCIFVLIVGTKLCSMMQLLIQKLERWQIILSAQLVVQR